MASNARITLRGAVTSLALAALLVLPAAQAVAQAQTVTIKFKNTTETFPDVNPCTGDPGTLTLTYNGVLHMTQDATGGTHTTGTLTGTFSFDATDPALPDYSGRFTPWFGDNNNSNIDVATFTQWVNAYAQKQTELADFYFKRFRTEFRPAVDAWVATRPLKNPGAPLTPFAMPQYKLDARVEADRPDAAAEL